MNFLSKTLSTLTGTSIPYTFKDEVPTPSIWKMYQGTNPKDNSDVTIFEMNLKDPRVIQMNHDVLARNSFKKLKSVKFPDLITIIDFIESDTHLYLITEPVVPASQYLSENEMSNEFKVAGVFNIGKCLEFLNTTCNYVHGSVGLDSVYVNKESDWKLFGYELLTNLTSDPDQPIYRLSSYYPNFSQLLGQDNDLESIRAFPTKFDSYLYGKLITSLIPSVSTNPAVKRLIGKNNTRPTIDNFMKSTTIFKNNLLIKFNEDLKNLQFSSNDEKLAYFKYNLSNYFPQGQEDLESESSKYQFPKGFLEYKLLPELINQFNIIENFKPSINSTNQEVVGNQESLTILLNYILKFGSLLLDMEFNKILKPIIIKKFESPDRSIRLILLNHLKNYQTRFTDSEIQAKFFNNLINGFKDTNFMIREITLTSINLLFDKISAKQINQDLLKLLAKGQNDPKPSIRVNTLILIIKISSRIYNNSKNNVLITALSKSLKDSFIPCKMMALSGFQSLINEFSLEEICNKILGQLATGLMDPKSLKVRNEASKTFKMYFEMVEKYSRDLPNLDDEIDEESEEKEFFKKYNQTQEQTQATAESVQSSDSNLGIGSSFGSGFGWGMVNKLVTSSVIEGQLNKDFNTSTPDLSKAPTPIPEQLNHKENVQSMESLSVEDDWNEDTWGMDDFEEPPAKPKTQPVPSKHRLSSTRTATSTSNPATKRAPRTSGLKLGKEKEKKPSNLKLVEEPVDDDGWGGTDDW